MALVFTDLVSSTELANRIGPGPADDLRREHFTILRDATEQGGGREVKNLGDGLMLAFGSPTDAVDATVRMQQAVAARNLRAPHPFEIRIGIAVGEVTEEDDDYFGEPVVVAARLCARADGGQVLLTDLVRVLAASSAHDFRSVGDLALKGLPDPVPTHEVAWAPTSGAAVPLPPRLRGARDGAYVGRGEEQAQLDAVWVAALGGAAQLVLLAGEPGIGKTRLSTNHAVTVHRGGGTVLYGAVDEGVGIPYQPWIEALDHYVAHAPQPALDRSVADAGADLVRLVPRLGRRVPDLPAPSRSDGETERYLLLEAVTRVLAAAAADNPVLVVLDDLHWADTPTLHLLAHLHRSLAESRVLFVATYRDSELTPDHPLTDALATLRRNDERVTRVALSGLGEHDLVELLTDDGGRETTDDVRVLAHTLERDTDGNPLFVTEILRDLREGGHVHVDDEGRWTIAPGFDELPAPQGVREVVAQRVGRLGPDAARVLATAAVIGREFELELLAAVLGRDLDDLLEHVDAAMAASLLTETGTRAGSARFVHGVITQALVDDLTRARRSQLHRRIASSIEELYGPDLGERIVAVARHVVAAGERAETAMGYARRAGSHALEVLAPDEAMRWFRTALELYDEAGHDDAPVRAALMTDLGAAMLDAGVPGARDQVIRAAQLAEQIGDGDALARAVLVLDRSAPVSIGDTDEELVGALETALRLRPARDGTRARLLVMLATEQNLYTTSEARQALVDEAVAIARDLDSITLARVLASSLGGLWTASKVSERLATVAEIERLLPGINEPKVELLCATHGFIASVEACDRVGTEHHFAALTAATVAFPSPMARWLHGSMSAVRALLDGDLATSARLATDSFTVASEAGLEDAFAGFAVQTVDQHSAQGRMGELVDLLEERWRADPNLSAFRSVFSVALVESGRIEEAGEHLDAVVADIDAMPESWQWAAMLGAIARVANRTARADAAAVLYRLARRVPDVLLMTGASCTSHMSIELGMLASTLGRRDDAVAHFERADAALAAFGAPVLLARNRYEHARALHELGDPADRERAHQLVERSLAEYRRLDLPVRVAQCEELLAQLG
jgi:hypothetical protein